VDVLPIVRVGADSTDKITVEELGTLFGGRLAGTQYVYVAGNGTPEENGNELKAAYDTAANMYPSITNRITVIVGPGKYVNDSAEFPLATGQFEFIRDYIDVVSLTGGPDVFLSGISVGGDCYIKGMNTSEAINLGGAQAGFNLTSSPSTQKIENCIGGNNSFGFGGNVDGTFINCIGGSGSFASVTTTTPPIGITDLGTGNIGGIFINCEAASNSFGNYTVMTGANNLTGTFTNCKAGSSSFGWDSFMAGGINLSGLFTNCSAGPGSFGGLQNSILSGTFINCKGEAFSFAGGSGPTSAGECSGIFTDCLGGNNSFGYTASGTFNNCIGGAQSFASNGGTASGTFYNCISGIGSFGASLTSGGTSSGTFTNCIGGDGSFGTYGTLSGNLYYCRLTTGLFTTVSGLGKTIYCVDGNGDPNNQGFTPQNNL
jgi:hypothetical protein